MCGRYAITVSSLNKLLAQFGVELVEMSETRLPWTPRYNVAPTTTVPAVRNREDGKRELVQLRWGLIPPWAKDTKIAYSTINARADTVATKPAFRSAFKKRRCLIIADGYYEWRKEGKAKLPLYYQIDGGKPFAFAGLWEWWRDPADKDAEPIESCTIITTDANELAKQVHDRMPVILDSEDYGAWLACDEIPLVPFDADRMTATPVSTYVNNVKNQGAQCLASPDDVGAP